MKFKPNKQQEAAIFAQGNILVSAAAGSGKTAVLVERVIKKITDKTSKTSIDKLLIVTFTNLAAEEMRLRIEKRLDEEIKNNPDDENLRYQKYLLPSAKICTIDSFCIDLVRENFEKLSLSPDFKICDKYSLKPTDYIVLDKIFKERLDENNPDFINLLDILGCEHSQEKFFDVIFDIFDYSRQLPFPKKWFDSIPQNYKTFSKGNVYYDYIINTAARILKRHIASLDKAFDLLSVDKKIFDYYYKTFKGNYDKFTELLELLEKGEWDDVYLYLSKFQLLTVDKYKNDHLIPQIAAARNIFITNTEEILKKLSKFFACDLASIDATFQSIYQSVKILSEILIEFDEKLFEEYKKNNTFTFHNTEHLALKLLCDEEGNPSQEFLSDFDEVLVDEYQDTNDLQDKLFTVLSNNEEKLFMVGDIKQSIYAFRGANPSNFNRRKNTYALYETEKTNIPQKIILKNNYRSCPEVCEFVNYFFGMFMNENTGEIIYDNDEKLVPTAKFPPINTPACEIDIIDGKVPNVSSTELEAVRVADYIQSIMQSGDVISDKDKNDKPILRPAKFSDFAILLRSHKKNSAYYVAELKRRGIPVTYETDEFADTTEIVTFLSLLKVVDNPKSDVELLTVLLSPIFSFTPEEIANMRAGKTSRSLFSCLVENANNGDKKSKDTIDRLEKFRLKSLTNSLPRLITILLSDTGYLDIVSTLSDGEKRRNNLLLLVHYAENFNADVSSGISSFVEFITAHSNSLSGATASSDGNAVRIMSIHASKGLEFPVCIIASANKKFNDQEKRDKTLYLTDYGVGFKYYDNAEKALVDTISKEVILDKINSDKFAEELRLLYVAMTRAKDKLLIIGTVSNLQNKLTNLTSVLLASDSKIDDIVLSSAGSFLYWIILSLILSKKPNILRENGHSLILSDVDCDNLLEILSPDKILNDFVPLNIADDVSVDYNKVDKIKENFNNKYRYAELSKLQAKTSVTGLLGKDNDENFLFSARPSFMLSGGLTQAEKGSAMHKVIECFDFAKSNDIEKELTRLYEYKFITEAQYNSIDRNALKQFFASELFERIKKSNLIKREMRFITEIDAQLLDNNISEELKSQKVILQGAIDLCFIEDDKVVILDFKTDKVGSFSQLKDKYTEQLSHYATACEKIFGKAVKEKIIYSFNLGEYGTV